jgi:carbon-monoxide dehydrogenase medium subunit
MKPPPFDYYRPETLDEALDLLASHDNCRVLAGGQSLMPMMNFRYVFPDTIIDINRIDALGHCEQQGDQLVIGAMVRQRFLERSPLVASSLPIMQEALHHVGHRQTRNRGTIGGSLSHMDPAAELPLLCILYDAEIRVASANRQRTVAARDFLQGYMTVQLEPDELVTKIVFPIWPATHKFAFLEHARRHGDFAIAAVGCLINRHQDGRIAQCAIAVGGMADKPFRLEAVERMLMKADVNDNLITFACQMLTDVDVVEDIHADADYRRHVTGTLLRRALTQALA